MPTINKAKTTGPVGTATEEVTAAQAGTIQEFAITTEPVGTAVEVIEAAQAGTIQPFAITTAPVGIAIETITVPEIADVDFYKVFDAGTNTFTDLTAEANEDTVNDAPLLPATPIQVNDAHYVGSIRKFDSVIYIVGTLGGGTYSGVFEYWDGSAWTILPIFFGSETDLTNFRNGDKVAIYILPPSDMDSIEIDGDVARWVRYRITSIGVGYTQPLGTRMFTTPLALGQGQVIVVQF